MAYIIKDYKGQPVLKDGKEVFGCDFIGVVKGVDFDARTLRIIASDESKDRDGDIVKQAGWDFANYIKNPVFLWAHDYGSVPLAAAKRIERKRTPWRVVLTHKFPTAGLNPFADMILALYNEKIINAGSVGFIPKKWDDIKPEEGEPQPSFFRRLGRMFLEMELLEHSGCAVPSNPSAIQEAVKGITFPDYMSREKFYKFITGDLQEFSLPAKQLQNFIEEIQEIKSERVEIEEEEDKSTTVQVPKNYSIGQVEVHDETIIESAETIDKDLALKPYPNEHACRLKDPSGYDRFARKNCNQKHDGKCIDVIFGVKDNKTEIQALRYPKKSWESDSARKHCGGRGGKFEAAKDDDKAMDAFVIQGESLPNLLFDPDSEKFYSLGTGQDRIYKEIPNPFDPEDSEAVKVETELKKIFDEIIEGYFSAGLKKEVGQKYTDKVEVLIKAGAVLNRKNKTRLKQASALILEVLTEAEGLEDEPAGDPEKTVVATAAADSRLVSRIDGQANVTGRLTSDHFFADNIPASTAGGRAPTGRPLMVSELKGALPVAVKKQPDRKTMVAEVVTQIQAILSRL